MKKPWYLSKTIWVGVLQAMAAISTFAFDFFTQNQTLDDPIKITMFINGIVMIVLRLITDQGIRS
tara:strand:- start:68 stop:262 length:195 start_codon:yes stop_codon:yes gene_type:complete